MDVAVEGNAWIEQLSGDGTLVQNSTTSYTLDLGTIIRGQGMLMTELGVNNDVSAPADELAGDFDLDAADFALTGFETFDNISAGSTQSGLNVQLDSTTTGIHDGLITLSPRSENSQGFSGDLPEIEIAISARAVLEADFNEDGNVDSDDFADWQTGFGTLAGAAHGQGDADVDADVDGADFLAWQRQFGGSPNVTLATTEVPEPKSILLMLACLIAASIRSRNQ